MNRQLICCSTIWGYSPSLSASFLGSKEGYVVDFSYRLGDIGFWTGRKGEMEVTKADDKVIEGRFFFTATGSPEADGVAEKTIEVTEGYFRIPRELEK